MRRRRFLGMVGASALGAVVRLPVAPATAAAASGTPYGGKLYRGDTAGFVYVSDDGGKSWSFHSYLGRGCSVIKLAKDKSGRLRATIGSAGGTFPLFLASDARSWLTR